jgi:hypothetical protein
MYLEGLVSNLVQTFTFTQVYSTILIINDNDGIENMDFLEVYDGNDNMIFKLRPQEYITLNKYFEVIKIKANPNQSYFRILTI